MPKAPRSRPQSLTKPRHQYHTVVKLGLVRGEPLTVHHSLELSTVDRSTEVRMLIGVERCVYSRQAKVIPKGKGAVGTGAHNTIHTSVHGPAHICLPRELMLA